MRYIVRKAPPETLPPLPPTPPRAQDSPTLDLLNTPADFDPVTYRQMVERDIAESKARERERFRIPPEGVPFTPMWFVGECPAGDGRVNATYPAIKRHGKVWHLGCDPAPDVRVCALCGAREDDGAEVDGFADAWVCSGWCWPLSQAAMWLTRALAGMWAMPKPRAFR